MPKRYRDFCLRVIDSERLTPTVFFNFNSQEDFTDKINELILQGKDQGFSTKGISDKWHTFEELYYHRMILTYIILKNYPSLSWKSKQHHDGTMFDDSFIVGINTPKGQYSYHYDLEYWDLFDVRELDKAPIYDGHKPEIARSVLPNSTATEIVVTSNVRALRNLLKLRLQPDVQPEFRELMFELLRLIHIQYPVFVEDLWEEYYV